MWVLVLVVGSHQGVYTGDSDRAERFTSLSACRQVEKAEMQRLQKAPIGKFTLYCTPADGVVEDDE